MTRLTSWFDELAFWPTYEEIISRPAVQRMINIGMWIVAPIDYPTAVTLSHLLRSKTSKHSLS